MMRNREEPFSLRIKYEHPSLGVFALDSESGKFERCFSIKDANLDYDGIWLLSAGNSVSNPDLITIEQFALYNPDKPVTEAVNTKVKKQHKKDATYYMA